jgi:hypothetical protein
MILAAHAIAGAALGRWSQNPVISFALGFASHFVLDAIPHWQYKLNSKIYDEDPMKEDMILNKDFVRDIFLIGLDCLVGFSLSIFLFQGWAGLNNLSLPILFGSLGGVSPDALQFLFWKLKEEPLLAIQKFHKWAHAKKNFAYDSKAGFFLQIAVVAAIVLVSKILIK